MKDEDVRLLMSCGLNEAEARTYVSLASVPEATAAQLARIANVPRNRIYEILESLQALELVEMHVGSPNRRFRARSPDTFLQGERDRVEARLTRLAEADALKDRLFASGATSPAGAEGLRILQGRVAANHEAATLVARAAEEGTSLVIAGTAQSIQRLNYLLRPYFVRAGAAQRRLEVYLPYEAERALRDLKDSPLSSHVRWLDIPLSTISILRDDIEALWILPIPDTPDVFNGADISIHTPECAFATDNARFIRRAGRDVRQPEDDAAASVSSGGGKTRG